MGKYSGCRSRSRHRNGVVESVRGAIPTIGALYGVPTFAAGWVAHLSHSVMLALVFGVVVSRAPLREFARRLSTGTALGTGYGVVLTVITGGIVLPLWLMAIGVPERAIRTESEPDRSVQSPRIRRRLRGRLPLSP
jgi:hypothetical protein